MADRIGVHVTGLKEFDRALRAANPELRRELIREMKGVSGFVRDMAVFEAHQQGLDSTGDLIAGLKPGVRGAVGYVKDTARHRGYPYPGRLEYQDDGRRSFLRRAVEKGHSAIEDRLIRAVEQVVDKLNT